MVKNALIYSAFGLFPMLEYELDIVQRLLHSGFHVKYITCEGDRSFCSANNPNIDSNERFLSLKCSACKSRVSKGLDWLQVDSDHLTVESFSASLSHDSFSRIVSIQDHCSQLLDNHDLTSLRLFLDSSVGFDLYDSCCGQLITLTENVYVDPFKYKFLFLELVKQALTSFFGIKHQTSSAIYDEIYIYNGRIAVYRPLLRFCQMHNLSFKTYEYPLNDFTRYAVIPKNYIHDFDYFSRLLCHSHDCIGTDYDQEAATFWLKNRINRKLEGAQNVFLNKKLSKLNVEYKMPSETSDKYIAFFPSTIHEFACIPEFVENLPCSQSEAVRHLANAFPSTRIVVRLHPNSNDNDVFEFNSLYDSPQVTIIPPSSPVNSYSIIKQASLVIVYGSTIGVEAAYLGVPVISLAPSFYNAYNFSLRALSVKQLITFTSEVLNNDLSSFPVGAKSRTALLSYVGAYISFGVSPLYVERKRYDYGAMIRDGTRTKLNPHFLILIILKIISLPERISRILFPLFS